MFSPDCKVPCFAKLSTAEADHRVLSFVGLEALNQTQPMPFSHLHLTDGYQYELPLFLNGADPLDAGGSQITPRQRK
jgi:hypothetical protein